MLDTNAEEYHTVTYMHRLQGTTEAEGVASWAGYSENFRQGLRDEFLAQFGSAMQDGSLVIIPTAGLAVPL